MKVSRLLAAIAVGATAIGVATTTATPAFAGAYNFRVVLDVIPDAADDWQVTIDQDQLQVARVPGNLIAFEATLDDDADPTLSNTATQSVGYTEPLRIEATSLVTGAGIPEADCNIGDISALSATAGHIYFELSDWAGETQNVTCTIQVSRATQATTTTTTTTSVEATTTTTSVEPTTTTTESVATTSAYVDDTPPARTRSSLAPPAAAPAAPAAATPAFTGNRSALLGGVGALFVLLGLAVSSTGRRRSQR